MIMTAMITIVTGLVLGFSTSARTPTDGLEDLTRNIIVGTVGAFLGLQVVNRLFNSGETPASFIALTIAAILGASILLFVVNRVRRA